MLSYAQCRALCDEIKPRLQGTRLRYCEEASQRKFVLLFDNEERLLLCFQEPFLRFHLLSKKIETANTPFAIAITDALVGATLSDIDLLDEDRILCLTFDNSLSLVGEFFPKRPNFYLVDSQGNILASVNPCQNKIYQPPQKKGSFTASSTPLLTSKELEKLFQKREGELLFEQEKHRIHHEITKRLKHALRLVENYRMQKLACEQWEVVQHEATLLQANLFRLKKGMSQISVSDWAQEGHEKTISIDPLLEPAEQVNRLFKQSKKLRKGLDYALQLEAKAQQQLPKLQKLAETFEKVSTWEQLKPFQKDYPLLSIAQQKKERLPSLPYYEYFSAAGLPIWVGKSAKDNEKLTFTFAKGSDWWFHVSGCPGSHVVLRIKSNQDPDEESIKDAIQLAIFYSKAKNRGEAEVCITQCKYVSRFGKGQPGKVQISKHKISHAKTDPKRITALKNHKSLKIN